MNFNNNNNNNNNGNISSSSGNNGNGQQNQPQYVFFSLPQQQQQQQQQHSQVPHQQYQQHHQQPFQMQPTLVAPPLSQQQIGTNMNTNNTGQYIQVPSFNTATNNIHNIGGGVVGGGGGSTQPLQQLPQAMFFNNPNGNAPNNNNTNNTTISPAGFTFAAAPPQLLQQLQQQQVPSHHHHYQQQQNQALPLGNFVTGSAVVAPPLPHQMLNNNNNYQILGGGGNNNHKQQHHNNSNNNNNNRGSSHNQGNNHHHHNNNNNSNNRNSRSGGGNNNNNNTSNNNDTNSAVTHASLLGGATSFAALTPNPAANNALHHIPSFDDGVKKGFQDGLESGQKEAKGESVNLRARIVHLEAQLQKALAAIKKLKSETRLDSCARNKVEQHQKEQLVNRNSGEEGEISFTDFAKGEGEDANVTHHDNHNNDPSLRDSDDVDFDDSVSNRVGAVSNDQSVTSDDDDDDDDEEYHHQSRTPAAAAKLAPGSKRRAASLVESIESLSLVGEGSNVETTASGTIIPKQHVITAPPTSHVNYLYTSLDDVVYERFEPGKVFAVALPKSKSASHRIASECLLKTKALEAQRHVLTHCAHYYFNRICNRGDDCCFVHAISVPDIRVWGKTIDRQPIEFVGTAASTVVPTTTVVIQQQQQRKLTTTIVDGDVIDSSVMINKDHHQPSSSLQQVRVQSISAPDTNPLLM